MNNETNIQPMRSDFEQIYETGELKEEATIRKFEIVQIEGEREVLKHMRQSRANSP